MERGGRCRGGVYWGGSVGEVNRYGICDVVYVGERTSLRKMPPKMIEMTVKTDETRQGKRYGYSLNNGIVPSVFGKLRSGFTKFPLQTKSRTHTHTPKNIVSQHVNKSSRRKKRRNRRFSKKKRKE